MSGAPATRTESLAVPACTACKSAAPFLTRHCLRAQRPWLLPHVSQRRGEGEIWRRRGSGSKETRRCRNERRWRRREGCGGARLILSHCASRITSSGSARPITIYGMKRSVSTRFDRRMEDVVEESGGGNGGSSDGGNGGSSSSSVGDKSADDNLYSFFVRFDGVAALHAWVHSASLETLRPLVAAPTELLATQSRLTLDVSTDLVLPAKVARAQLRRSSYSARPASSSAPSR